MTRNSLFQLFVHNKQTLTTDLSNWVIFNRKFRRKNRVLTELRKWSRAEKKKSRGLPFCTYSELHTVHICWPVLQTHWILKKIEFGKIVISRFLLFGPKNVNYLFYIVGNTDWSTYINKHEYVYKKYVQHFTWKFVPSSKHLPIYYKISGIWKLKGVWTPS